MLLIEPPKSMQRIEHSQAVLSAGDSDSDMVSVVNHMVGIHGLADMA